VDVVDLDLDAVAATHPFMGPLLGLGVKSYMVVPMVARQRLVGFLTFISLKWNYDHRNVACAEELARRAALCIDNARLYGEAQTASRVREEFLSAASHELKTPLTSLKLQVHSLLKMSHQLSGAGTDKLLHRIEGIGRQVERQCELVNVLLDVSRIHADRLVIEPEEFDLALLVRAIAARYDDDVGDARAKLKLRCPPELPVTLDRLRVDQVVTNLVSNAIKFGCGRPVDLDVTSAAEEIEIVVKDRGIGISPADRSRIFGRFERAVSHHNFGGFGLGLWITTQIVRAMGGSISVESTVDVGSTFTIRLPRQFQASP
jgi:signal transduction histidine kinase